MDYPMPADFTTYELTRTTPDSVRSLVEVRIGAPAPCDIEDSKSEWYCTLQILGIDDDHLHSIFGADSIQAHYLAQYLAGVLITASPFVGEIAGSEDNYGFPATAYDTSL